AGSRRTVPGTEGRRHREDPPYDGPSGCRTPARSALGRRRCHAPTHCGDRRWGAARLAVPPSAVGRTAVGQTAVRPTAGRRGATRRVAGFRQREGRAVQGPTGRPPARPYGRTK